MTKQYIRRIRLNATSDMETVTSHVVLVEMLCKADIGEWLVTLDENMEFCNAPSTLPIEDQTTPIGSPWK
jgi:hypothetical protein